MFSTKYTEIFRLLLLTAVIISYARSYDEINNVNNPAAEVADMFDKIEENQLKLKQIFTNILLKEESEDGKCVCVPFYLCNATTGQIVRDGSFLLETRMQNPCENEQDICCEPYNVKIGMKMEGTKNLNSRCGYGSNRTTKLVDNDLASTKFGEFPWTVIVLRKIKEKKSEYSCAGSLIHPQVVLTAAHCVNTTSNYTVFAGDWDMSTKDEPVMHQKSHVQRIIKHPMFNMDNLLYNVALLITANSFELDEGTNTICLTKPTPNPIITNSDKCLVTGWGSIKPDGKYSNTMKKVEFSLELHEDCQKRFRSTRLGKHFDLHQTFICASGLHGYDACNGNGGAPLICPVLGQPGRYQQVGITSWGIGCAENLPTVFTKIAQVKSWIDQQLLLLGYSTNYFTFSTS